MKVLSPLTDLSVFSIAALCGFCCAQRAFAQGRLTPSGPPAPMMKTLEQIEPRTIVNEANTPGDGSAVFNITNPGSYYLTNNVLGVAARNGITISTNNVTLDLNGFAVAGIPFSFNGVRISSARTNICVRNGVVCNWGVSGIEGSGSAYNSQFIDLRISVNGQYGLHGGLSSLVRGCVIHDSGNNGINVGTGSTVEECAVTLSGNPIAASGIVVGDGSMVRGCASVTNAQHGITNGQSCVIKDCTVTGNTLDGINAGNGSTISDCAALFNDRNGLAAASTCTLRGSTAIGNQVDGILTAFSSTVTGCAARRNLGRGIHVGDDCTVRECIGAYNSSDGIWAGTGSVISECTTAENEDDGIDVQMGSTVRGCTSRRNAGDGIEAGVRCSIFSSVTYSNFTTGINVSSGSTVKDCLSSTNVEEGILVRSDSRVTGNHCEANNYGIRVSGSGNRIEENHATRNRTRGIQADQFLGNNVIVRNTMRNNAGTPPGEHNYSIAAGNFFGPVIDTPSALANGELNDVYPNNHPWANFADPQP
jgi:parallel beta-helix repeat protein